MQTDVTPKELLKMLARQDYRCALSGRQLTPDNLALDHIEPISAGGEHSLANSHLVCEEINRAKGTLSIDEFVALCCDVAAHVGGVTRSTHQENFMGPSTPR